MTAHRLRSPLIVLFIVVAIGTPWRSMAQQPIRIGASMSVTGSYAEQGAYGREGYLLWQKHVNGQGGVLGRKADFVIYDDGSDPQVAVRLYEKLIAEDKVDAVMGPYSSPITEAVANVTEKHRKIMIAPMASATSIWEKGRRYIFMMLSPSELFLEGFIDLAARNGLNTIALIYEGTLFPKAAAKGSMELAQKKGMGVVLYEAYPKGKGDFAALVGKVKAAQPDALGMVVANAGDPAAITRQMKKLDVNVKMLCASHSFLPGYYKLVGKLGEFVYGSSIWEPHLPYPGNQEFVEAYHKEFGRAPSGPAATSYAGCQLLCESVQRAGSLNADKVREELLRLRTATVFGSFAVDERGFQIGHKMVTTQWQDGKQVVVWPDEAATGKPRFPTPLWSGR